VNPLVGADAGRALLSLFGRRTNGREGFAGK
jgi:hypothetical protein